MNTSPIGDDDDGLTVEEWLYREMKKMLQELMLLEISYDTHQTIWGVPCGPVLSMVHPPEVRGLCGIQHNEQPYTPEQEEAMWKRVSDNLLFMDEESVYDKLEWGDENGNKIFRY